MDGMCTVTSRTQSSSCCRQHGGNPVRAIHFRGALPVPFAPVHLLFINLLTDSLPAIAIGMEPAGKDLLSESQGIQKQDPYKRFMPTILTQGDHASVP